MAAIRADRECRASPAKNGYGSASGREISVFAGIDFTAAAFGDPLFGEVVAVRSRDISGPDKSAAVPVRSADRQQASRRYVGIGFGVVNIHCITSTKRASIRL
ncbi:MAG: hypothetical protein U0892_18565 [Pirellulales bacterium]